MEAFDVQTAINGILERQTDAEKAEWAEFQRQEREKLQLDSDPAKHNAVFGYRAIELSRQALEHDLSDEQRAFEIERLAEGLALTGELEEAERIAVIKKQEYQDKLIALVNIDCEHIDSKFLTERFLYKGNSRSMYKCVQCGNLTARD